MLKRRYPSSSSSDSSPCWALRPVKKLPTRHGRQVRKVQRIASTHSTIPIPPTLQSHRSKEAAFSSTDTELSSSDTELGTALSDVESAINHPDSSPGMRLSSPERESDEIDDSLGDARMSYSPSPPPAGWAWKDGKMVYDIPVQVSFSEKGKGVEGNDRKRRRLEVVEQQQEEEDEADDEMEAENMLSTPKQKVKRKTRVSLGISGRRKDRRTNVLDVGYKREDEPSCCTHSVYLGYYRKAQRTHSVLYGNAIIAQPNAVPPRHQDARHCYDTSGRDGRR